MIYEKLNSEKHQQKDADAIKKELIPFHAVALPDGPALVYVGRELAGDEVEALRSWVKSTNRASELVLVGGEPTLSVVLERLEVEKAVITKKLGKLPMSEWNSPYCKRLCNREQELFTTTAVLKEMLGQVAPCQPVTRR